MSPLLAVGRIVRAHGVHGEVSVLPLSEVEARFSPGAVLLLGPEGDRRLTVRASRPHAGRILVRFEEVAGRTEAGDLRGLLLLVPEEAAPPIEEEGRFWVHEVVGLAVRTEEGRRLGRVREVLHNPANDVWVVDGARGEILVPAVREVVASVDVAAGEIVVRDTPGLLDGWEEA